MTDDNRRWFDGLGRFVRDVGFPAAVAGYLLLGLAPKVDAMKAALDRLVVIMEYKK